MQNRFRISLVAVAALAIGMFVAGPAAGDNLVRVESTVTLAKPSPFHGHVSASEAECVGNRLVRVIKLKSGSADNQVVGSTHTNDKGRWSIPTARAKGAYYARVKRRKKAFAGSTTTTVCTADHSAIRHFDTA
jgi:hypothetical protein